jgi:hypothetical protein
VSIPATQVERRTREHSVTPPQIKFDLLSNARDSLRHAVELLVWKDIGTDHARLKHAITNAAHSIELLLKERLGQVHPAFIWEQVDKFPSLEARTVTVDYAVARLKKVGGLKFREEDERILHSLRKTRNAIEHYEWHTTEKEAKVIVGNALSFALSFAAEHLSTDLAADFKSDDTWRLLLNELYDFARAHGRRIEAQLRQRGDLPSECESCGEITVPMRGGSCELCGHWQQIEDV